MKQLNIPSYNSLLPKDRMIRAIQDLYNGINTLIEEPTSAAFNPSWRTTGTLAEFCSDVVSDPDAVVGDVFLGEVSCSGLPEGMSNGELEVKVTQGQNDKLLLLTLTSTNLAPYHWEQSYYNGTLYGWKASDPDGAAAAVEVALTGTDQDTKDDITIYGAKAYADSLATNYDAAGAAAAVLGTSGDAATAATVYGAKAYTDAAETALIGASTDLASANTIYGAKAFATEADQENAYFQQNLAVITALSEDPNAATTTVTTNPEWKVVYTDSDDRILLGKKQDNTWYFATNLDDILDAIIDGYDNP